MIRLPLEPREAPVFSPNRWLPGVPSLLQEEPSRAPAWRTTKRKAKSSRRTRARNWPPPSPGSYSVFRPATHARRSARKTSPGITMPTLTPMCFWYSQGRNNAVRPCATRRCSNVVAAVVARAGIVRAIVRGVLDAVLVLIGVLLVVGILLSVAGRVLLGVLLGVLGRVLLAQAPVAAIIIVDGGFATETAARAHAAEPGADAQRIIVPGKEAANRIGEKNAARDACRGAERTRQKAAARAATLAAPWARRRAGRSVALRGLLPAALRRRRLVPAAARGGGRWR